MQPLSLRLLLGLLAFSAVLTLSSGQPKFCHHRPDPGPCRGKMTRYYYNPASKTCEKFTYGGCLGNENNFKTLEKCRYTCIEKPGICPRAPPGTITICPVRCGSDWECPGKQKCCHYACIVDCMNPI